ncbi:hypothetical protein BN1723_009712 [Verticillium longisporum]|uniref:NodB homology domain-containing protein n=1 Tax=Verticillium longisporum TaxID=100787 RepID=A0A0G4KSH9_VERLO|nr:hypothetical protein BN1723_009712 [Verticillium longisporum]
MRGDIVALALASLVGPVAGQASDTVLAEGRDALQSARFGRRQAMDRKLATVKSHADVDETETTVILEKRQGARCGIDFGTSCEADIRWCGQGYLYCSAPSCQIEYGPACDANIRPSGPETKNVPRPKVGSVPYGTSVRRCTRPGDIALTYDDGPYIYTDDLLDKLKAYNAKATFYVTGNNLGKGKINDPNTAWPGLLRRMVAEGHQIASHTWSHQRLTTLTESKFRNQMNYLEIALADLFGYFPTYMRPPYSACDGACETLLNEFGYHITYFDLDTEGYLRNSPLAIQGSKDIWDAAVEDANPATAKFLHIEHDPVQQSVYNLTDYMLASLQRNGFRAVTVGECLGDPKANWYRTVGTPNPPSTTRTTSVAQPTGTLPATTNGRCGFIRALRVGMPGRLRDVFRLEPGRGDDYHHAARANDYRSPSVHEWSLWPEPWQCHLYEGAAWCNVLFESWMVRLHWRSLWDRMPDWLWNVRMKLPSL